VKSFDSGDNNRDLHMLQVTRGPQFPLIGVLSVSGKNEMPVRVDMTWRQQ
jgi:hypothetical protein